MHDNLTSDATFEYSAVAFRKKSASLLTN